MIHKLFEFQKEDVAKLRKTYNRLIANEMGTGKTYEAIALDYCSRLPDSASAITTNGKTLVIAPLSTLDATWRKHFEELTNLQVCVINPKKRKELEKAFDSDDFDVMIVHWDALRLADMQWIQATRWQHIIADEVHKVKNRKTKTAKALKRIPATFKTGLTGTPVLNKPDDIWSILNWLYPQFFRSYWKFRKKFVLEEVDYWGYTKILGCKNEDELMDILRPFYIRRLKSEVLKDLPPKYYTTLEVTLGPKQISAYRQMKKEMIAWLDQQDVLVAPVVITQLLRLQQLAIAYSDGEKMTEPSTKLDALMTLIVDNPGKRFVIFSCFKQALYLLEARLTAASIEYVRLTGDDSPPARHTSVTRFQNGEVPIFLGTIAAGSEGINLTAANTVVFLDRDWTPARNSQAEDRLHRIGQDNAVQVLDIIAKGTVDLYKDRKLSMKKYYIKKMLQD